MQGKLLIFSAPSGSGKTTLVKHLLREIPTLQFSISACSRPKRPGEMHGHDYFFFSPDEFMEKVKNNEFVEWEEVYPGQYYGTLRTEMERIWKSGHHVIFDVDVIGGLNIKRQFPEKSLAIFIKAPSIEALEQRLRARSTETEESIQKRVGKAKEEINFAKEFDVVLVNDQLEKTLEEAVELVNEFLNQ